MKAAPTTQTRTTVLIVIDAGRATQIGPETMPFLSGLARRSLVGSLGAPTNARDHDRSILFDGPDAGPPDDPSAFVFDPAWYPGGWRRRHGPARILRTLRKATRPFVGAIGDWTRAHPLTRHAKTAEPHRSASADNGSFTPPDTGAPAATLLDLCRAHGRTSRYHGAPTLSSDAAVHDTLVRDIRDGAPCDLFIARFGSADRTHTDQDGTDRADLRDLDDRIASVHAALTARYDNWDLFVCSEDTLSPTATRLDLHTILRQTEAEEGTDYILHTTPTLATIWYRTGKGRRVIERLLPHLRGARLLDEEGRRRHRFPVDRRHGDRLVIARPGATFQPGPPHPRWTPAAAFPARHGVAILASNNGHTPPRDLGDRALADFFPTLCDLVGIPVPETHPGKSLLHIEAP